MSATLLAWCILNVLLLCAFVLHEALDAYPAGHYIVRPDDSLRSIAEICGVSVTSLKRANDLTDADPLWPGQSLIIPRAPQATAAAGAVQSGAAVVSKSR